MTTRAEFVAAARALIGTPTHSHGRIPGVGIDCIGVPVVAAVTSGIKPEGFDIAGYGTTPDGSLLPLCDEHMVRIGKAEIQPGDVVVVRWRQGEPQHFGVVGDWRHGGLSIIHADDHRHKCVIEHRMWFGGSMRLVRAFRVPGLT